MACLPGREHLQGLTYPLPEVVVRELLKAGADAGLRGGWQVETARALAAEAGHGEIAAMLGAPATVKRVTTTTDYMTEHRSRPPGDGLLAKALEADELTEEADITDCWSCSTHKAVLQFAANRLCGVCPKGDLSPPAD
jgi:hypothetical protein